MSLPGMPKLSAPPMELPVSNLLHFANNVQSVTQDIHQRWKVGVRAYLEACVGQADVLLKMLEKYGAVISGSFVLCCVLQTNTWTPGDLDIIVPTWEYATFVEEFKNSFMATEREAPVNFYANESEGFQHVLQFNVQVGGTIQHVDIIQSVADAITAITFYHSTVVMNYITHDKLVIGFPYYTLRGFGIITCDTHIIRAPASQALSKYERRGFILQKSTLGFPEAGRKEAMVLLLTDTAVCSKEDVQFWRGVGERKGFF